MRLPAQTSSVRRTLAAASAGMLVLAASFLVWGRQADEVSAGPSAAQLAAAGRMVPYQEVLSEDLEAALSSLPEDVVRRIDVAPDGLSASGVVGILSGDGSCAAVLVEMGPAWLLDGDRSGLSVSEVTLVTAEVCTGTPTAG